MRARLFLRRRWGPRRLRPGSARGRWITFILVAVAVLVYARFGASLRPHLGLGGAPIPAKGTSLRVVTWNLANFEGDPNEHDLGRMRGHLEALDADLIAVEEIKNPAALRALRPRWTLLISRDGGRGEQRLGFFFDPDVLEVVGDPVEHRSLTAKGRVRPAYSAYFRSRDRDLDLDFHALVVHLKARPDGFALRVRQWGHLRKIVETLEPRDDADVILLGDFNTTGAPKRSPLKELAALDARLGDAHLRRLENTRQCSAYWDGGRRDAWQEPSLLDLIFVRGFPDAVGPGAQVHVATHCAEYGCEAFRSTPAYPVLDYAKISDHCPVILDLRVNRLGHAQ